MQYTLSILVENQAGVLSKISGLFSRRGFNIDSLAECSSRVDTLVELLKPYGIREIVRTGTVALDKGATAVSV